MRRPEAILENGKNATFLVGINRPITQKLLKEFTKYRKKACRMVVFSYISLANIP